ncbi:MAG: glycosyltransferase [Deltaproteobacteria bacterium]|nr:glycosyltransferase [Deltaproteobacteria bacterium]
MKVVHIVEDLGTGGLEKVIAYIVLALDKKKYDVQVWCLARGGQIADELIDRGICVKILDMDSYYNPFSIIKLAGLLKRNNVIILHTHGYFGSTFGRLGAILARTPIVITHVHTTYYNFNRRNLFMERFLSLFTVRIICISQAVERFVVDVEAISEKKTCLIYNGVDEFGLFKSDAGIEENRKSLGFGKDDVVAITVASLTGHKGHRVIIDAVRILSDKHEGLRCLIVGDGHLRRELKSYCMELGLSSKIAFTGQRKDIMSLLRIADLFVLASTEREGLGIALIEAEAARLPLIGTKVGGIPEVIVDNRNGLLVAPKDVHELASAMERLIKDKALREKMGEAGRKMYEERFSAARMIKEIELLYDRLTEKQLG